MKKKAGTIQLTIDSAGLRCYIRMMRLFLGILFLFPLAVLAQNHSSAPLIAVGNGAVAAPATTTESAAPIVKNPNDFPAGAVTTIKRDEKNHQIEAVSAPVPASPANPATPKKPDSPEAPASPPSPVSKLWPADTIPIFLQSCMKFHVELAEPCSCIITNVMKTMGHDEFIKLDETGTMYKDPRILAIEHDCVTKPRQRKD